MTGDNKCQCVKKSTVRVNVTMTGVTNYSESERVTLTPTINSVVKRTPLRSTVIKKTRGQNEHDLMIAVNLTTPYE